MGLAERRAIKAFQEETLPELIEQISEVLGFKPEVSLDYDALAEDGMDHLYQNAWPKVYFEPAIEALKSICADDMGKEAAAESLKSISIVSEKDNVYPEYFASLADGVLKLDHKPFSNIDHVDRRAEALQQVLEDSL